MALNNKIVGSVPATISSLTKLTILCVHLEIAPVLFSDSRGPPPHWLTSHAVSRHPRRRLNDNSLVGTIPLSLSALTNLATLCAPWQKLSFSERVAWHATEQSTHTTVLFVRRGLEANALYGTIPNLALTKLTSLCACPKAPPNWYICT